MTRTAIRHTIFALATTSLLIVFTSLTAYAQSATPFMPTKGAAITSAAISGDSSPEGLATRKSRQSGDHDAKINATRNVRSPTAGKQPPTFKITLQPE